jgi:hypothetical protein
MRVLNVVRKNYYCVPGNIELMYLYFTVPLRGMGHDVGAFDPYEMSHRLGRWRVSEALLDRAQRGRHRQFLRSDCRDRKDSGSRVCVGPVGRLSCSFSGDSRGGGAQFAYS